MRCRGRHAAVFDDDMRPNAEALGVVHRFLWERACSRKRLSRRPVFCGCTGLFASKLAPTGPTRCRGRHAAVVDDDMRPHAEALGVVHRFLWERACSRKRLSRRPVFCVCTGLFASKLAPTGPRRCRGRHTGIFDDDMRPHAEALGVVHRFLWERACLRKRLSRRPVFCVCTGLFASKLAPTGPMRCRGRHAAVFDDDMRPHAEALGVVHRSCGSNKHKAWGRDLGIFKRTAS
ncbi:hypothetical protein JOE34_000898 [Pseudomonas sp. PvP028]|nr:hypothetical protein [Pseudomonas sp. PvP028]